MKSRIRKKSSLFIDELEQRFSFVFFFLDGNQRQKETNEFLFQLYFQFNETFFTKLNSFLFLPKVFFSPIRSSSSISLVKRATDHRSASRQEPKKKNALAKCAKLKNDESHRPNQRFDRIISRID